MNDTSIPRPARPWPKDEFIIGVNLPWVQYGCDFGASAWFPAGGLAARPEALATFEAALDRLARDGVTLVRHFLLCDCRSGVRFDAAGVPLGLDDTFFRDADAALDAAAERGIALIPVLFDFHLCDPPAIVNGVQLGGHAELLTDPSWRAALIARIVRPIVERYGRHPAVAAWDLFNEPDWCVSRLGTMFSRRAGPFDCVRACLGELAGCVGSCASQPQTVGLARAAGLDLARGIGLDFYQVHWYERFGWNALAKPVDALKLDRPVLLGEFPGRPTNSTPGAIVAAARAAGYCGAFVWSVLSEDDASGYEPPPPSARS